MDSNSSASGETLNIKTRKPYTITKQRERWTEDEHNRFLEALKLYGRAWQRIEDHIGTKTAVQIRSHAQKFFTKLEKEAIAKGIPISQALDVEIPPPRPKRKPSYPYPRKTDPKTNTQREKTNESYITNETRKHQEPDQDGVNHTNVTSNMFSDNHGNMITEYVRTCPRHVPVQVVDVNQESNANNPGQVYEHANLSVNISAAASETSGHPYFNPFSDNNNNNNQDSYKPFLHFSSTIPSLIVSSLLQNPAAHAAASFAAKFWHPEASSADSHYTDQLMNPSMAAIAAATVAAATAWWSAHGLLPVCTPFNQGGYSEKILNSEVNPVDDNETVPILDSSKLTGPGKQVDRSSCGSNATSGSEIEINILETCAKEVEETKESDVKESVSRRGRSVITPNDSWKEVSEEGRLAFQELFTREILPQSFSDVHTIADKGQPNMINISKFDRNRMSHRHTGFKPYKRCSIEAKENSKIMSASNQNDEKGVKRMRVATEAST